MKTAEEWIADACAGPLDNRSTRIVKVADVREIQADALRHAAKIVDQCRGTEQGQDLRSVRSLIQSEAAALEKEGV